MKEQNMTHEGCVQGEQVSALADGQLQGEALAQAMTLLADSEQARGHWQAYHLVGDVLRSTELARTAAQDADFVLRLRARLQAEAAPRALAESPAVLPRVHAESANGPHWRWAAGLASLAALSVVGWQLVAHLAASTSAPAPQLAQATQPVTGEAPHMIRDPRLDQLLAAHQQAGGTSALQMPAGFLRNATFERPAR
jgi:sigma-E factor negative regulatory protein RseA